MFSALLFIISLDSGVAPSGDQVLRINMSSRGDTDILTATLANRGFV